MGSKFKELMKNYGKVKQFPIDAPLMPLSKEQKDEDPQPLPIDPSLVEEDPQLPEMLLHDDEPLKKESDGG